MIVRLITFEHGASEYGDEKVLAVASNLKTAKELITVLKAEQGEFVSGTYRVRKAEVDSDHILEINGKCVGMLEFQVS